MSTQRTTLLLTIISWIIWFLIPFFLKSDINPEYNASFFLIYTLLFLMSVVFYYTVHSYLLKHLVVKGKYIRGFILFSLSFLLYINVYTVAINKAHILFEYQHIPFAPNFQQAYHVQCIFAIIKGVFYSLLAFVVRMTYDWFKNNQIRSELEKEQLVNELALLRAQINPHFLFNTLNNIYTLVYKKSDLAPDGLMKLSSVMRYLLKQSESQCVDLQGEIDFIHNYVDLQQLRYADKNFIKFTINGSPSGKYIAPLLFISFVENAFKHSSLDINCAGINIQINIDENIMLTVENDYSEQSIQNKVFSTMEASD